MTRRGRHSSTLRTLPSLLIDMPPAAQIDGGKLLKTEWRDPSDTSPNAARSARMVAGYRRHDPLRRCFKRHGQSCGIDERKILAADRLRRLADAITIGFSGPKEWLLYVDRVRGSLSGPTQSALKGARAWPAFRRAIALFNAAERDLITGVVLLNRSVSSWCKIKREEGVLVNDRRIMQMLVACLTMLEEHFASEIDKDLARGMAA